ncbi:hypothetical protein [Streptomyces sp. NPDC004788]
MPSPSPADTRLDLHAVRDVHTAETVTAVIAPPGPRARRRAPEPPHPGGAGGGAGAGTDAGQGAGAGGGTGSGAGGPAGEAANDVVRWGVFCCVLVPVVLVVYGTSLGGAAGAALGLAAVTAACRVLLRRAERGLRAEGSDAGDRRDHSRS